MKNKKLASFLSKLLQINKSAGLGQKLVLVWVSNESMSDTTDNTQPNHTRAWLRDKVIGEPKATNTYSVSALRRMNMIGVYRKETRQMAFALIPHPRITGYRLISTFRSKYPAHPDKTPQYHPTDKA